jgi:hypothetical protein
MSVSYLLLLDTICDYIFGRDVGNRTITQVSNTELAEYSNLIDSVVSCFLIPPTSPRSCCDRTRHTHYASEIAPRYSVIPGPRCCRVFKQSCQAARGRCQSLRRPATGSGPRALQGKLKSKEATSASFREPTRRARALSSCSRF